jgi:DNA-binding MurR/RpiR family transcriptional regulator
MSLQVRLGTALEARILGIRPLLSNKEQAVAAFLLSDPKEFISLSISAIAFRCRVSETVVIRLYRKLGFEGFHQFKIDIAQSLTAPPEEGVGDLKAGDSMETIKRKVFAVTRQALEESAPSVQSDMLSMACEAILSSRRIVVIAFGGSVPVAMDLVHKLLKLGMVATLQTDSHLQVMAAAVLGAGDLLVAVSHSGNSRDIIEALEAAQKRGVRTLLITGIPHSPATVAADICLYAVCRETTYQTDAMTSRTVQLAIIDTLYVALIFSDKERAITSVHDTSVAAARKKL